ncbi:hypothetical protein DMB92_05280 [Campylobacter sp. MIT 99-7217]|uniref:hypothetical protein n=1 Tax=Campylobacter sp. MIT 99-7217 TaxID=535091 RepID=UPI00115893EA|nr:hypothetical protein [Campylobacter sp. MIT 99-7217]TQR31801.1 hypothetical protein DMB92_05280 [Campylobacter sp. MIT 99-7217]
MNAVGFIDNFNLAAQALESFSMNAETKFKAVLELALKLEEIELNNRKLVLEEEKMKQELELKALESKNKYENATVELIKNMVQAQSMIKSVWDNANINKCNALVGLFNVVMNAQNTTALSDWKTYFTEIKNSIHAIGNDKDTKGNKNSLIDDFDPLMKTIKESLKELNFANANIKKVAIISPKLELVEGESVVLRGISIFASTKGGFEVENKSYDTSTFLFKGEKVGDFPISYFTTDNNGTIVKDNITLKVLPKELKRLR